MTFPAVMASFATLVIALPSYAFAQGTGETPTKPKFTYCSNVSETVLELRYSGGMIENPDPTPFVKVTCDGVVFVHWAKYTKKAGDYTLKLWGPGFRDWRGTANVRAGEVTTLEIELIPR